MGEVLRAGVIGAGVFGGYHAQKYAALPGVSLVGVYDHHAVHAEALAARCGGEVFQSADALIAAVDIVSIVTPAVAHAQPALAALQANKSVYIEKPLAADPQDAARIAELAAGRGVVAACGFLERAALQAMGLFDVPEAPKLLEAVRTGPPSSRNLDVSVVLDVMIHDIDLALALAGAAPAMVEADGAAVTNTTLDRVDAEVEFDDGFVARFRASRVAEDRERMMRIVYPSGEVRVDFLTHAFSNTTPFALDPNFEAAPAAKDKLGASLAAFVAAVRGERARPLANARDGVRSLELALAVEASLVQQGLVRG